MFTPRILFSAICILLAITTVAQTVRVKKEQTRIKNDYADGFEVRQASGEKQKQLSKEFVREWLIQNEFMGKEGQTVPEMTDEWINTISKRYIELFEKVTGFAFEPQNLSEKETKEKISKAIEKYIWC